MIGAPSEPDEAAAPAPRLNSKQRREQLLACAVKVFAERGFDAANHTTVAEEAGVSVGLCFFYFKSRDALVDAVLGEVEKVFTAAFALADHDSLNAAVALKTTSNALLATREDPRYETWILVDWSVAVRSSIWPRFLRLHRHLISVLTRVIARGQRQGLFHPERDPADEAELLHAASFALSQLRMVGAGSRRIQRFQQSMMRRIQIEQPAQGIVRRPTKRVPADDAEHLSGAN